MQVLLAPDKFKGSLSAREVVEALSRGILQVFPDTQFHQVHASDGGDGFLEAVAHYCPTEKVDVLAEDPLRRPIRAAMQINRERGEAYIEMAQTSGLVLLNDEERSAKKTSSRGTGIQIREALNLGLTKIYIGLGGSATNDGGTGIADVLGVHFLDTKGNRVYPSGENLRHIKTIDSTQKLPEVDKAQFFAVNDVNNPLCGPNGAAHVYARQKGATPEDILMLDEGLAHLDRVTQRQLGISNADIAGSGAAGGAAYGLKSFLGAQFIGGTHFILNLAEIPDLLTRHKIDYILTGEGKIDAQTLSGKWINGITELGRHHGIPVIAVCGLSEVSPDISKKFGLDQLLEAGDQSKPLSYNMENAAELVEQAIMNYFSSKAG